MGVRGETEVDECSFTSPLILTCSPIMCKALSVCSLETGRNIDDFDDFEELMMKKDIVIICLHRNTTIDAGIQLAKEAAKRKELELGRPDFCFSSSFC